MGKQTTPRVIAALPEGSLQRSDAEELYADTPKRVLFDAVWTFTQTELKRAGNDNPYNVTVELTAILRQR